MHESTAVLFAAVGLIFTAIASIVGFLSFRRTTKSSELSDFKTKVDLWELEIGQQGKQIVALTEQVEALTEENRQLRNLVTSAAKVAELADTVKGNQKELVDLLKKLEGKMSS